MCVNIGVRVYEGVCVNVGMRVYEGVCKFFLGGWIRVCVNVGCCVRGSVCVCKNIEWGYGEGGCTNIGWSVCMCPWLCGRGTPGVPT